MKACFYLSGLKITNSSPTASAAVERPLVNCTGSMLGIVLPKRVRGVGMAPGCGFGLWDGSCRAVRDCPRPLSASSALGTDARNNLASAGSTAYNTFPRPSIVYPSPLEARLKSIELNLLGC